MDALKNFLTLCNYNFGILAIILFFGYGFLLGTSGMVVGYFISRARVRHVPDEKTRLLGRIIGKCENILVLTFTLLEAYTAFALIFTAKSIIRHKDMEARPEYYVVGTMVNFAYSFILGLLIRFILLYAAQTMH